MRLRCLIALLPVALIAPFVFAQAPQPEADSALLDEYCVTCHNAKAKTGGLSLEGLDTAKVTAQAEVWEKVIRKLRVGAMPPNGMPKPAPAEMNRFLTSLETRLDRAYALKPDPGRSTLHRLNRTEYANAIKDLLNLEIDPAAYLLPDDESYGFDNMADVLKTSPALLERYLSASWKLSRLAVGNKQMSAETATYRVKPDLSQDGHLEGMPLGTRGGAKVTHTFPLDGEYEFRVRLWRPTTDIIRGIAERHQVEVSVDGDLLHLVAVGGKEDAEAAYDNSGKSADEIDRRLTFRVPVKAGQRELIATFRRRSAAQDDDILQPFIRTNLDPVGYQGQPVVDRISIAGPFKATGVGDTPSRRQVFLCMPKSAAEEMPCAKRIIAALAKKAYRRPVGVNDMERLVSFYQTGRNEAANSADAFERGIEAAVQRILASPEFIFRFEAYPKQAAPLTTFRISDLELASRLSFFLWSAGPDDQLLNLATTNQLRNPVVLRREVKRMLADPRSRALVDNFAGQWLYLRNLKNVNPDFESYPDFDDNLRQAMRRETEMLFENVLQGGGSVMDLLNADYTFVNERLARHYGMKGIYGNAFRRVPVADESRRGLLGHAGILTLTSYATRTSPVQRGKWILTNLLGTPPPAPPPNVPALEDNKEGSAKRSLRQRMEAHRANPVCATCHKVIDPVGFALENYDAIGRWRDTDEGAKIDPTETLFDGTKLDGPQALRKALLSRPDVFVRTMTERLMTYALGRGVEYYDQPAVRNVVRGAAKTNYAFVDLVMGIVNSPAFQMKKKPGEDAGGLVAQN